MCAQAMLLSMVLKSFLSCHVSKSFSASAKWLALDEDLRCSAACKLDDGNRLDAHAILA
jgi:hypothetical protein